MRFFTTLILAAVASAQTSTSSHATSAAAGVPTAVTGCHLHGATQYCLAGTTEYEILTSATGTQALPASYTGCHSHGSESYCIAPGGNEVRILQEGGSTGSSAAPSASSTARSDAGKNCHFHAGVEHCVGEGESENGSTAAGSAGVGFTRTCDRTNREYNIPLRVGLLFVMLVTSAIGVFGPMVLASKFKVKTSGIVFVILKQFGTGVIISTAFVHLFTHATLLFSNPCIGVLNFEATTASIVMAGLFLSFLVDYASHRYVDSRSAKAETSSSAILDKSTSAHGNSSDLSSTETTSSLEPCHSQDIETTKALVLEAGIVFHSLLIGLTLVVAGDSFFLTLFAVIVFHQMFEGLALGTLVAELKIIPTWKKFTMGAVFTFITPIGMAIGIGVLKRFNGNDPATLIAIGTLDALSAGILVWVGVVEMWAHDWMFGRMAQAKASTAVLGLLALMFGMGIMSFLGKWA